MSDMVFIDGKPVGALQDVSDFVVQHDHPSDAADATRMAAWVASYVRKQIEEARMFPDITSLDSYFDEDKKYVSRVNDLIAEVPTITFDVPFNYKEIARIMGFDEKDKLSDYKLPKIEDVIFSEPATIIKWADGTKTVVKCEDGDTYNKFYGFVCCIAKKIYGNNSRFNSIANKWIEADEKKAEEAKKKEAQHKKNVEQDRINRNKYKK